jgi:GSH-dependent disulfide-bond oxidoreductase
MIRFYFHPSPNPMKIALFLEESGLPYELVPIDTFKGEQHQPKFLVINPNAKVPAIADGEVIVFDSNAILLYLAEKTNKFLGQIADRGQLLSWLMFIATGVGPYSGQAVHFQRGVQEQMPYAINRYRREVERHYSILNEQLEKHQYIISNEYTVIDMAAWGWIDRYPIVLGEEALEKFPNLKRWFEEVNNRPAVQRARAIGKEVTFKGEFDEETRRSLFPQNY